MAAARWLVIKGRVNQRGRCARKPRPRRKLAICASVGALAGRYIHTSKRLFFSISALRCLKFLVFTMLYSLCIYLLSIPCLLSTYLFSVPVIELAGRPLPISRWACLVLPREPLSLILLLHARQLLLTNSNSLLSYILFQIKVLVREISRNAVLS